jgi:hypothetical protein
MSDSMARPELLSRKPAKASSADKTSRPGNALSVTTDVEKELMRLLDYAKNEPDNEHSRRSFESACEAFLRNPMEERRGKSLIQANPPSICAKIMSAALASRNVELIKLVFTCLATWLAPETISRTALACQQYGWRAAKDV